MNTYSLGIDIGYSAVKMVLIDNDNSILYNNYQLHKGKINGTSEQLFNEIKNKFPIAKIKYGTVTGSIGEILSENILIKRVNEIAATIEGSTHLNSKVKSIIELGGQNAKYIAGFNSDDNNQNNRLRINQRKQLKIESNTDCAAGTGSFLEEQASRLNIKIEDYASLAEKATEIPRIAGRCSVFSKTDIIHNQQEGVSPENILKGLAYAIVKNYKGSIIKRTPVIPPVLFIGGVAYNKSITNAFCDILNIDNKDFIVPEYFDCITAFGAALIAKEKHYKLNFSNIYSEFLLLNEITREHNSDQSLSCLNSIPPINIAAKHEINIKLENNKCTDCYLGVDIGSTSTNLVLTNKDNDIITYKYIRTVGNPLRAVYQGLNEIHLEFQDRFKICGVGVTGSGRQMIGEAIGADVIRDEITAQAKAAVVIDPEVDTIFEIGGQDSKYISIKNGTVVDFQMNKICAAGTGSFLEEQALKFDIPLEKFGDLALKGQNPVSLGERCTVFIESSISSNLTSGKKTEDIISGLCYSIAKNYLHRVIGQKAIGNKVFLQGGIAFNQGVLNALQIITRKKIIIPPFFSVTGALGVAVLTKEEMQNKGESNFIGFDLISGIPKSITNPITKSNSANIQKYNSVIEKLIFEDHENKIDPTQKTIGIPRALFTYGMFPMFNGIFKSLGFNVLLSNWSDNETIRLGQEYALAETCFPVKLITGHVAELMQKGVDYIFFPDLYTVKHEGSTARKNYGCAYMQLAFKIVSQTMELDKKGIQLLAPTIAFTLGEEFMKKSFADLGVKLDKTPEETKNALQEGMKAYHRFEQRIERNGKEILETLDLNKTTFVLISKTYGVSDPVLNLGIPAKLMDMGYQLIPFFNIPGENIGKEHPNMFWPFGEHILEPTYLIREHPNLYPILLTHHGCGPDSVLIHYFKELMGDKPYLNIEVDEHASKIGVETRIEAFVNSLSCKTQKQIQPLEHYQAAIKHQIPDIKNNIKQVSCQNPVYIPNVSPFSELICEILNKKGHNVKILPATNNESISLGREFTLTNEYYSVTSLIGDCFKQINGNSSNTAFLIPQTEGAELEGQYNRLLRTKLDERKLNQVDIISPFIEDFIKKDPADIRLIFQVLIAGDLINTAPRSSRTSLLLRFKKLIQSDELNTDNLKEITKEIYETNSKLKHKRILAIGEPMIVLNDYLNDNSFSRIEKDNCQMVYFSVSEAMWMFWYDYLNQNCKYDSKANQDKLYTLRNDLQSISKILKKETPFSSPITDLVSKANQTIGYFAGAFARYRHAKTLLPPPNIDGIITANSTYENTGVSLNILQKQSENEITIPILNLNFDGNKTDYSKIETFMYYL